jgi:hypothetical protein
MNPVRSAYTASHSAPATAPQLPGEVLSKRRFSGVNSTDDEENSALKDVASESTTLVESTHKFKTLLENQMVVSEQKMTQDQQIARADSVANHIRKEVRIGVVGERGCGMTSLTV